MILSKSVHGILWILVNRNRSSSLGIFDSGELVTRRKLIRKNNIGDSKTFLSLVFSFAPLETTILPLIIGENLFLLVFPRRLSFMELSHLIKGPYEDLRALEEI